MVNVVLQQEYLCMEYSLPTSLGIAQTTENVIVVWLFI